MLIDLVDHAIDVAAVLQAAESDEAGAVNAFIGTVREVVFDLAPHAHDAEVSLHEATARAAIAHGAAG